MDFHCSFTDSLIVINDIPFAAIIDFSAIEVKFINKSDESQQKLGCAKNLPVL